MKLDAWTLLWQVINLVVLLGLLRWLLFKPLLAVIAKRQAAVAAVADQAAQTASAAQARADALAADREALEARSAQVLADARGQARQLLDAAHDQGAQAAAAALAAARKSLAQERQQAAQALVTQGAALATRLAGRLLQQVAGGQGDQVFLDKLLAEVEATPADARAAWWPAEGPPTLSVVTAHPLPEPERAALAQRLQALLGGALVLDWAVDPALLAGAELRFAHGVLALHWAAELAAAQAQLQQAPAPGAAPAVGSA